MKKIEVIYVQNISTRARFSIEVEDYDALNKALDAVNGETFDDILFGLRKQPKVKVLNYEEEYETDWDAPVFYDYYEPE